MTSFATLKKTSQQLEKLAKQIEKENEKFTTDREEDSRFWQPDVDKAGNGMAIIRFLPTPPVDGEDGLPWVKLFHHGFKGPSGKWYIENSLTTLGQKDPVSDFNSKLWNSSASDDSPERKQARAQKRKLVYISNILVISDPKHPENEGQVKLFRYGKKIFDKIELAMNPEFEGDEAFNPFDFWKGANFKLKIRQVEGYRNYDLSAFDSPAPIKMSDEELEKIWNSEYSLKEFVAPDKFKSYDDLERRMKEVLDLDDILPSSSKNKTFDKEPNSTQTIQTKTENKTDNDSSTEDEDDEIAYFKKLMEEDD